jgi:hypothetical protein
VATWFSFVDVRAGGGLLNYRFPRLPVSRLPHEGRFPARKYYHIFDQIFDNISGRLSSRFFRKPKRKSIPGARKIIRLEISLRMYFKNQEPQNAARGRPRPGMRIMAQSF